ncbi:MAG: hypothetical protein ACKOPS_01010, partial [Cyanobium sp.]
MLVRLAREAGWRHLGSLALLSGVGSLLEIAGLGVGVALLLGAGGGSRLQLPVALPLQQGLALLVGLMLLRGLAQALVAVGQERLRSGFTDQLREQLLAQVLHAPSRQLEQLGRGDLLGLLMADISRSVLALSQAVRALQALLALGLYGAGVLAVGRQAALPLLLALAATAAAARTALRPWSPSPTVRWMAPLRRLCSLPSCQLPERCSSAAAAVAARASSRVSAAAARSAIPCLPAVPASWRGDAAGCTLVDISRVTPIAGLRSHLHTRLQQLQLLGRLAREAGWRHLGSLALLSGLGSLLEIAGLG